MHCSAHRNVRMFEKLCGTNSVHSVILVTTNWDYFLGDQERALLYEQELCTHDEYWGSMCKRGSSVVRHVGDHDSAMRVLSTFGLLAHTNPFSDHHEGPVERSRALSESNVEYQSAEQQVYELLSEYTTVLDIPTQHRRWTMDPIYQNI